MMRPRFVGGTWVGPAVSETGPVCVVYAGVPGVAAVLPVLLPKFVPTGDKVGFCPDVADPERRGSPTKYTTTPSTARKITPATSIVRLDRGFFGLDPLGTPVSPSTDSGPVQVATAAATLETSTGVSSTGGAAVSGVFRMDFFSDDGETVAAASEVPAGTSTGVSFTGGLPWEGVFRLAPGSGTFGARVAGWASSFAVFAGSATGDMGVPQSSQNFTPGASGAPHFVQTCRLPAFVPQASQNFNPFASGVPHFGQVFGSSIMNKHHFDLA